MRDYKENLTGIITTDWHYGDTGKWRVTPEIVAYQDEKLKEHIPILLYITGQI
jgi:hypothetical protein